VAGVAVNLGTLPGHYCLKGVNKPYGCYVPVNIKQVLKNSLIPRKRGKRVFALKRPIVVLDKHINRYKVIFDAIVSNTVHFSQHRFTTLTDVSMRNDIEQEFIHYNQHDLLIDCECELVV